MNKMQRIFCVVLTVWAGFLTYKVVQLEKKINMYSSISTDVYRQVNDNSLVLDSIMEQDYDISNVSTMAPLDLVPHVNNLVMAIARQEGYFANNAPSANAPPQKLREPEGEKPEHSWVAGYVGNEDLINEEAVEALREAKNAGSKLARKVLEDWVKYQRSLQQTSTAVSHSSDVTHDPVPSVGDTIRNIGQLQGNTQ